MKTAAAALRSSALAAVAVGLMFAAVPAGAQGVLVTAAATAPALARVVFAHPQAAQQTESQPGKLTISMATSSAPEIKPKNQWITDEGFSFTGARIGYKAHF
jgi:hypothetical protein